MLHDQGHLAEAAACFRNVLTLRPGDADAHGRLGVALIGQGQGDAAIAEFRAALQLEPESAQAHFNLGNALRSTGQLREAVAAYRRALQLQPADAETHNTLGAALHERGEIDQAIAAYRRSLELQPSAFARNNLGSALKDEGRIEESLAEFRLALHARPDFATAHSNLLFCLHYLSAWDAAATFAEHCRWDELHARPLSRFIEPYVNPPEPERRLRIGYVSPDFREHPVAFFLEGFLGSHDHALVEVFCYACLPRVDAVTGRLRQYAAHWRTIAGLSDERAAELIREDRIDILVDLAGHTAENRLPIFARQPAPVQVSYLGYCDTTGMKAMDYRLTDALADPPGATEHLHTEQLVRLPDCAWCFRPLAEAPPVSDPPMHRAGHVTFGCFNALPKLTDATLALWSRILLAVPGSHLLLKNFGLREPSVQVRIRGVLENAGIAAERVELLGPARSIAEHLAAYARVDLALDTFPYHGTTTTCEALWMGVPVIALAGPVHASRVGVSLLTNVGLPELIANDADDYVRTAVQLAADTTHLAELRATLRGRMASSPLMDAPRFTRNVELAYREMWRKWCAVSSKSASPPCPQ